jgi:predicted acylesterase/phospholipase RssA
MKGLCAEIGIMMALQDINFQWDAMIGTSAGAIVGSMLASGYTAHEAKDIFLTVKKKHFLDPELWITFRSMLVGFKGWTGIVRGKALTKFLHKHLLVDRIEHCLFPFYIAVTNVSRGRPEIKAEGPLAEFVRASAAIPVIYQAAKIDGEYYVDGGAVNNVALDELYKKHPDIDRFIIITTLDTTPDEGTVDNDFLEKAFTPARLLVRIFEAVAAEQEVSNLSIPAGKQVIRIKINPGRISLDEPKKIPGAVNKAYKLAKEFIANGGLDTQDKPYVEAILS